MGKWKLGAAVAAFGVFVLSVPAGAGAATRLVVGFDRGTTAKSETSVLADAGVGVGSGLPSIDARVITVSDASAARTIKKLRASGAVEYVQPDIAVRATWTPNDPRLQDQWALGKVGASSAWDVTRGATGVIVAVVDSGVDSRHQDLAGRVMAGYDYVAGDSNPMDEHGHGTHVAGIIAGAANNAVGIAGLAPDTRILPVRVLDARGSGTSSGVSRGIIYAADQGAKIINLSLGSPTSSQTIRDAIIYATSKGALVTCATGNDSRGSLSYPARHEECLGVGATTPTDARASFSNYGAGIDVSAPGVNILSTVRNNAYQQMSGTSMATPMVSGLAALLAAQGKDRAQIIYTITRTAKDLGPAGQDTVYGWGRIDAARAVASGATTTPPAIQPTPAPAPPTPPPTATPTPTPPTPPTSPTSAAPSCATATITAVGLRSFSVNLRCVDPDGTAVRYSLATQPANGTATIDATTGRLSYSAKPGFYGTDKLSYRATDGVSVSAPAAVTIKIG